MWSLLFIQFWLCWVFVAAWAFLQLPRGWGPTLWLWSTGFSLQWLLTLQSMTSRECGLQAVQHRLNNCGAWPYWLLNSKIFPDQGSNSCLLNRQVDSLPSSHQGSPRWSLLYSYNYTNRKQYIKNKDIFMIDVYSQ